MSEKLNHEQNIAIVNSLMVGYEFLQSLDRISTTRYFRQDIKMKVKALIPLLEKTSAIEEIWGIDDEVLYDITKKKELLMQRLAVLRPELKTGLNIILDRYFENPVETLNLLGIEVNER